MNPLIGRRIVAAVLGDRIEPALAPVLLVTVLSSTAFSGLWAYVGMWAVTYVHAGSGAVGVMYALDAAAAAAGGYFGGRLSDRVGRRIVIVLGWGLEAMFALALAAVGRDLRLGFAFVVLAGAASGPGFAATNAIVADLVPQVRQEEAYAITRVAANLGLVSGPPLAALTLIGEHWNLLFAMVGAIGLVSAVVGLVSLPGTTFLADVERVPRQGPIRALLGDTPFLFLICSTLLGYVVYVAYEVALPISAVASYGVSPAIWGVLVIIDPVLVLLLQVRLSRATRAAPLAHRLGAGMLLMSIPFLLLVAYASLPLIALVIIVFALGEMIWMPTAQALAANLAPARYRGAYMGAFGASSSAAWAVGPLFDLQMRGMYGDGAMWAFTAAAGALSVLFGMAACRLIRWNGP